MATAVHRSLDESVSTAAMLADGGHAGRPSTASEFGGGGHGAGGSSATTAASTYLTAKGAPVLAAESELSSRVQVTPVLRIPAPGIDGRSTYRPWYDPRRHLRKPKPGTWAYTWLLAYESIGIIYGDIGTSPLYSFTALFPAGPPSPDDVLGGLSCMIWTLLLVVVVKYVGLVLLCDDHGEGGTFAMYSSLTRTLRGKVADPARYLRYNRILVVMAIVGVSAVMSDGILTPAISVLSAIGGITVAAPTLSAAGVAGISAAILFLLILVQRFGTAKVSFLFSPIILVWFVSIVSIGIYYIAQVPWVFAAFSPTYAFQYFITNGYYGFVQLGAIILVVTGAEALFADLGHFNAPAIRISACLFVIPCLILAYLGQGAALILNYNALVAAGWVPGTTDYPAGSTVVILNTFFYMVPDNWLVYFVIISTLAAIIASQAMITASFSLVHQAMRLHLFPRVTVIHTDEHQYGQIYIPEVNYTLLVGILLVVAVAQNSAALAYAYGVTVSLVFVLTTVLYTIAIVVRFERHWIFAALFFCVYMVIDVAFLGANLLKFTTGAWFPVAVCTLLSSLMILWRWGRLRMIKRQTALSASDADVFGGGDDSVGGGGGDTVGDNVGAPKAEAAISITINDAPAQVSMPVNGASEMARDQTKAAPAPWRSRTTVPNMTMLCYTSVSDCVPPLYMTFLKRVPVRPETVIFVTVTGVNVPRVANNLNVVAVPNTANVWRATITHGYAESPPSASKIALRLIWKLDLLAALPPANDGADGDGDGDGDGHSGPARAAVAPSDSEILTTVNPTFLLGADTVLPDAGSGRAHRALVSAFAGLLRLSRSAVADFDIPPAMTLEVGIPVAI